MSDSPHFDLPKEHVKAVVIYPYQKDMAYDRVQIDSRLEEGIGLAAAIKLEVVYSESLYLRSIRPATLIGKGSVSALKNIISHYKAEVAIIDGSLTPVQQRNLEKEWKCKVIDRTGLILDIFGARARTAEGRLQVELAALTYQRSRLVRSWTHLERQRGGLGFIGGPGETQLEVDRRLINHRISKLKKELEHVRRTRELHRQGRRRVPYPTVALVGYTNAGKSTLFNRLTHAKVLVADLLFATLDPTMRTLKLPPGQEVILSDTVGFISDLPTQLIAAFRATLEEVLEADLILHVRDISHPNTEKQAQDVYQVLSELGLGGVVEEDLVEALNKIDRLEHKEEILGPFLPHQVPISALTGEGIEHLLKVIEEGLAHKTRLRTYTLSAGDGAAMAWLYRHGDVLERTDIENKAKIQVKVRLLPENIKKFESNFVKKSTASAKDGPNAS